MRSVIAVAVILGILLAACTDPGSEQGSTGTPDQASSTSMTDQTAPTEVGYTVCWTAAAAGGEGASVTWEDLTEASGLIDPLIGMRGHAAAWGDINGDGWTDLFVGTFATARTDVYRRRGAEGPSPDRLLLGTEGGFEMAEGFPEQYGRTSGAALVDLDGDGDLDMVLSRNVSARDSGEPSAVYRNDDGAFAPVDSGIDPDLGGRSIGVIDYDGDGLLDLVIVEDRYSGASTRVYRNRGDLTFSDATAEAGLPADIFGLGVATGDFDGDGLLDLFVGGSNRLFRGTRSGFDEVPGAIAEWETFGVEDDVAGAAVGDLDRDGRLDLVVGHHFNSTVDRDTEVPVRLYMNRTESPGSIEFEDVTDRVGLIGLPTKAPHVEVADLNNDGWPDIFTSASAEDGGSPATFVHQGLIDGLPSFSPPDGLGSEQYWVGAPLGDYDRDGRLDSIAVEWDPGLPSILFANRSPSGHWIEVTVDDRYRGVGARVEVYEEGGAGDPDALLGVHQITATVGYTAGVESVAHVGLGETAVVDLVVIPMGGDPMTVGSVQADTRISTGSGC